MTVQKGSPYIAAIIFLMILTWGCKEKKVTITKDYVINPNWSKLDDNSFEVYRMKLKDSSHIIDLTSPSEPELFYGLIADTSFSFFAKVTYNGEDYRQRKVYFNKDNGFTWFKDRHDPRLSQKIIGKLQQETWYRFAGLSDLRALYYVYLDTSDSLHVFIVSTMTNI